MSWQITLESSDDARDDISFGLLTRTALDL
jgi:hypothetical protein